MFNKQMFGDNVVHLKGDNPEKILKIYIAD